MRDTTTADDADTGAASSDDALGDINDNSLAGGLGGHKTGPESLAENGHPYSWSDNPPDGATPPPGSLHVRFTGDGFVVSFLGTTRNPFDPIRIITDDPIDPEPEFGDGCDEHQKNCKSGCKGRQIGTLFSAPPCADPLGEALADLDILIGLKNVKRHVRDLIADARIKRLGTTLTRLPGFEAVVPRESVSLNQVLVGPPGTGKAIVARQMGRIYHAAGLIDRSDLIEVSGRDLVSDKIGGSEAKVDELLERGKGGTVFIDETYSLCPLYDSDPDFGREVLLKLMTFAENNRDNTAIIFAGYPDEMERLMKSNPGLRDRFNKPIHFPTYGPDELIQIFDLMTTEQGMIVTDNARLEAFYLLSDMLDGAMKDEKGRYFANARSVRKLVDGVRLVGARRVQDEGLLDQAHAVIGQLEHLDSRDKPLGDDLVDYGMALYEGLSTVRTADIRAVPQADIMETEEERRAQRQPIGFATSVADNDNPPANDATSKLPERYVEVKPHKPRSKRRQNAFGRSARR